MPRTVNVSVTGSFAKKDSKNAGVQGEANHGELDHLWRQLKMDYNMDAFRRDVARRMTESEEELDMTPEKLAELLPEAFAIMAKKEPSDWAKGALEYCKEKGYMVGDQSGNQ